MTYRFVSYPMAPDGAGTALPLNTRIWRVDPAPDGDGYLLWCQIDPAETTTEDRHVLVVPVDTDFGEDPDADLGIYNAIPSDTGEITLWAYETRPLVW